MKFSFLKALLFLYLSFFILLNISYSQTPQFIKEKIKVIVNDEYYQICGYYYFHNSHSVSIKRNLFYPFALNSNLEFPDSIGVIDQNNENITFFQAKTGIYFPIEIPPGKTVLYRISFQQKTTNSKAEYILTTTKKWGRALEKADFIIKLPTEFDLKHLSYEFDEIDRENKNIIYKIHKENFMPDKNLIVEWARSLN